MAAKRKAKTVSSKAPDKGTLQRLLDQRTAYRHAMEIHSNPRLLKEIAFYPAHDKRRESREYKKVHDYLTDELDLPCLVCGVKKSTLKKKDQNRYGAKQMETHHHVIEWALANAIDVKKFNDIMLPHLRVRHPSNPDYAKPFSPQQLADWVDHSQDNLWVLCDVHHRAKYLGIHEITYPIWCPIDLLKPNFESFVQQEIAKLGPTKASKKAKPKTTSKSR